MKTMIKFISISKWITCTGCYGSCKDVTGQGICSNCNGVGGYDDGKGN